MKRKKNKIGCPDLAITLLKNDNTFSEISLQVLENRGIPEIDDAKKRLTGLMHQWT